MKIDVILFDWGGTLSQVVRQEEHLRRGVEKASRLLCAPWREPAHAALLTRILSMEKSAANHPELREADFADVLPNWAHDCQVTTDSAKLETAVELIGHEWVGSLDPFPDSAETLRQMRARGYRMGIVSNCMIPERYCLEEFRRQGFDGLVDFHVFSSAVGYRKPSPRIYEAAVSKAFPQGVPQDWSRVLFVGDSPAFDVAAPARLGMKTALVACKKGIWSAADYAQARPDFTIDTVAALPALLA